MAVDNSSVIDFISINKEDKVVLTISDHLKWNEEHLLLLQDKINSYIEIIENKHIYEIYPDANDKEIIIQVSLKYKPNNLGKTFLEQVTNYLESKNYKFSYYKIN
ncbi:MAG: hypothetical protein HC854_11640 [Flavobacterium sp.]|nr:hypothetical protein [Flavobacterium sp.]